MRFTRDVFSGRRSAAPLQFIDDQTHHFGQKVFFQVRRSFGR